MEKMTQGASLLLDGQIAMLLLIPDKNSKFWTRLRWGQVNWCDDRRLRLPNRTQSDHESHRISD